MRQKYLILKSDENNELIIREFTEQSKEMFSLVCEETYDSKIVESSMAIDKQNLISTLRTRNFYPPEIYADKIAESVMALYGAENNQPVEVFIDDADWLDRAIKTLKITDDIKNEPAEPDIDELLDDDLEDNFDDSDVIIKKNYSIKVADDESDDDELSDANNDS
ncbi:MAG: hypothetical protein U9Q38_06450 [Thermodesulfobacteriota bacterium]|nr:hypothetical protein [Thermodesulfobacteriota bacterium]